MPATVNKFWLWSLSFYRKRKCRELCRNSWSHLKTNLPEIYFWQVLVSLSHCAPSAYLPTPCLPFHFTFYSKFTRTRDLMQLYTLGIKRTKLTYFRKDCAYVPTTNKLGTFEFLEASKRTIACFLLKLLPVCFFQQKGLFKFLYNGVIISYSILWNEETRLRIFFKAF